MKHIITLSKKKKKNVSTTYRSKCGLGWVGFGWKILPTRPMHTPNCNKVACPHFYLPYKKPLSFLIGGLILELQNAYCLSSFAFRVAPMLLFIFYLLQFLSDFHCILRYAMIGGPTKNSQGCSSSIVSKIRVGSSKI